MILSIIMVKLITNRNRISKCIPFERKYHSQEIVDEPVDIPGKLKSAYLKIKNELKLFFKSPFMIGTIFTIIPPLYSVFPLNYRPVFSIDLASASFVTMAMLYLFVRSYPGLLLCFCRTTTSSCVNFPAISLRNSMHALYSFFLNQT